jgi:hypothetical protein
MVATRGRGWQLAPCLVQIVDQFDKVYPRRDRSSDGSIGDQAHASRSSAHNPSEGWVHAVDIDEDVEKGRDLKAFAKRLERSRDNRIRYVIYESRILKAYASNGKPAWTWHPYDGPNAHAHHLHLSINRTAAARNDKTPWPVQEFGQTIDTDDQEDYVRHALYKPNHGPDNGKTFLCGTKGAMEVGQDPAAVRELERQWGKTKEINGVAWFFLKVELTGKAP